MNKHINLAHGKLRPKPTALLIDYELINVPYIALPSTVAKLAELECNWNPVARKVDEKDCENPKKEESKKVLELLTVEKLDEEGLSSVDTFLTTFVTEVSCFE